MNYNLVWKMGSRTIGSNNKFEHSCFISYKRAPFYAGGNHFYAEFVKIFEQRLTYYLTSELKPFRDNQLLENPGIRYKRELIRRLCKSICMIAILVPEYIESNWCRYEWQTMEYIERYRLDDSRNEGLIIPVKCRGNIENFAEFVGDREIIDLHVNEPKKQLRNIQQCEKIESIANKISRLTKQFEEAGIKCEDYDLPIMSESEKIIPSYNDPNPMVW